MCNKSIFSKILTVGSDYKNSRGGIGSVLTTYSNHFDIFKFIAVYPAEKTNNLLVIILIFLKGLVKVIETLRSDKDIEIVHMHGSHGGSLIRKCILLVVVKKVYHRKVIYHSHSSELKEFYLNCNMFFKRIINYLLRNSDLIVCLSIQWKEFFIKNFAVNNIIVLENIIDYPKYLTIEKIENPEKLKLLFFGEIGNRKGIFDLLAVINENKTFLKDKVILSIGGNGDIFRLESYIKNNELQEFIIFEGWVIGERKKDLLSNSDVYILPSYNEGLPISILEAMSYGKPIISTNVGGIPEIVKDNKNGFLTEPGNKVELFQKINFFMHNRDKIKIMGNKSKELVEPYYAKNVITKLKDIYIELLT